MLYVDSLLRWASNRRFPFRATCHLFADSTAELHAFALRLGMERAWFQIGNKGIPHYDLNAERRELAIRLGAVELTRRESVAKWRDLRAGLATPPRRARPVRSGMVQPEGVEPPTLSSEG
jgi:hypothetical protein